MEYLVVDAFTDRPFGGNPASVVWLDDPEGIGDELLANIAAEFKHAETAYVCRSADGGPFGLRWFTPACEVPLCGHATLAAAHALWQWGRVEPNGVIEFSTRFSGTLVCRPAGDKIAMDFPATPSEPCPVPYDAARILGVPGPVECIGTTAMNVLLVLPSELQVRQAAPLFNELASWHGIGVIITAEGDDPSLDFVSRFFAPAAGIDEDPVTGSAHCALTPYWADRLGRTTMNASQLSPRGGKLQVSLIGNPEQQRVGLVGDAVTVMEGRLLLD